MASSSSSLLTYYNFVYLWDILFIFTTATSWLLLECSIRCLILRFYQEVLPMNGQYKLVSGLISSKMDSVSHSFTCGHVKRNQDKRHN